MYCFCFMPYLCTSFFLIFNILPNVPLQLQEGSELVKADVWCDGAEKITCISSGVHFLSPPEDCLIAFQTAITSSSLYRVFLMITMSYYFSNKNSTALPLCNVCTVDFNSTSCLCLTWISVFLDFSSSAIVIQFNLSWESFLGT